ncbi:MAG: phosphomannomutase/phosphoglucomutase, partial [Moraxellaceae bacterium]
EGLAVDESAAPAATVNPGWELRFLPAQTLGAMQGLLWVVVGAMTLAALLALGLSLVMLASLQKQVKEDAEALDMFSEGLLRNGVKQRPRMHFAEFARLLGRIDQYGSELRASKPALRAVDSDNLGNIVVDDPAGDVLGTAPAPKAPRPAPAAKAPVVAQLALRPEIFRAYDIRGVIGEGLDEDVARAIGRAIGSEALARGEQQVLVGRDGRLSSPQLAAALIEGLRASGRNVIDVGMVPTPVLYFAAKTIGTGSGVMITGSHNPGNYNGFKIMLAGDTLAGDEIQALRARIEKQDFSAGAGTLAQTNVLDEYVDRVGADIVLARPLKVVVDAGNGVAGAIAPRVLEALGCEVIPLFCDVDGTFPNHHPDPSKPENLDDLISAVASNGADIGIAFDGDGDRVGVVTAGGRNIFPDRLMMLLAKHVLMTNPGADIIFDVKCTRDLGVLISQLGGRPVMSKTGHSFIKAKLKETGAALAGEMSGHIFFNDRWFGFDDAIYAAARVLEILSLEAESSDQMFAEFPENPVTPEINIPVPEAKKFALVEALTSKANFPEANVITIDGLRVEFAEGWGLLRASNTTPCLVARFEGRTPADLGKVQERFRSLLAAVEPDLKIPF